MTTAQGRADAVSTPAVSPQSLPAEKPKPQRIQWRRARVVETRLETRAAKTLVLDVPGWPGHDAGQHVDVRLTAENGYTAQRSYSIASAPAPDRLELTVQKVLKGEVSPYFVDTIEPEDEFELRGPIGGWFRWTDDLDNPVLLIGGGSGLVPLMAMLRARVRSQSKVPFHLIYSARTPDHLFYSNELYRVGTSSENVMIDRAFTRAGLPRDARMPGRLRLEDIPEPSKTSATPTRVYVCGPNGFVESTTQLLLQRGHSAAAIRTERFGPTGG